MRVGSEEEGGGGGDGEDARGRRGGAFVGVAWWSSRRGAGRLSAVHPGGVSVLFCLGLEREVEDSCVAAS